MMVIEDMKILFIKKLCDLVLIGDDSLNITTRLYYLINALVAFAPVAIVLDVLGLWFNENQAFATFTILFIMINMVFGAAMNVMKNSFSWKELITKTTKMAVVVIIAYIVLEAILIILGNNPVVMTFRTTIQAATLLYPAGKILKNVFILSKGEHPPKWVMQKIYNFQENGDLKEFLSDKDKLDDIKEDE